MTHNILRLPAVKAATGLSRSTLYLRIAQGAFTHPVSLGGRAVGGPRMKLRRLMPPGSPESRTRKFANWWRNWKRPARLWRRTVTAMRKRRPNYRLVKIHRNYTVEEVARLFGTHKNTVRAWVKAGLPTCDSKRPMLILGRDLPAYLQARRTRNKRPCKPGEIYCVRCRAPKRPAGDMAEYHADYGKPGNLAASARTAKG